MYNKTGLMSTISMAYPIALHFVSTRPDQYRTIEPVLLAADHKRFQCDELRRGRANYRIYYRCGVQQCVR